MDAIVTSAGAGSRSRAYVAALLDWLACACAGVDERAARAVRGSGSGEDLLTRVAFAGTAGHIHDYDDTFPDGVAHVSATCAPAALVVAADLGATLGDALAAYTEAYETMAACAAASHPALYEGGWHPTAVCGPIGAAVAAAHLFELTAQQRDQAVRLALLGTGGTRGAFGSDGKAIQVGLAAAHGVRAARLARGGARVDERAVRGKLGFEGVFGVRLGQADAEPGSAPAITRNWIKLYPSCLGTHAPIEAALAVRAQGHDADGWGYDAEVPGQGAEPDHLDVTVHPVARQAAHLDRVTDPLEGKFSIPYCVALALLRGQPRLRDFDAIDERACTVARHVTVNVDPSLAEFGAVVSRSGAELARVPSPLGSPMRPISPDELASKVSDLAGERLAGIFDDLRAPAARALSVARLSEHEPA